MWSWRLRNISVYPRLFRVFFSSFPSLPECPKYKPSITQLLLGFYVWIKLDFYQDFFMNVRAQIEKLIAKIKSTTWNAWVEISLATSFGVKRGVEDLAVLSVYPSPFGYLGPVCPNWPNAPNTLKQVYFNC